MFEKIMHYITQFRRIFIKMFKHLKVPALVG